MGTKPHLLAVILMALSLSACGGGDKGTGSTAPAPPSISSISPSSSVVGATALTLTVTGASFTSVSVIQWNGSARTTTFGSATQLTAAITQADLAIAGSATVSVSNGAAGTSANVAFGITPQIANGTAMPGAPTDLVINAAADIRDPNVGGASIVNGVYMDRLNVFFAHDATVDQVNKALSDIAAGVVSVTHGFTAFTIGIPRQSSVDGLQALVDHLKVAPGVHHAGLVILTADNVVFITPAVPLATMAANIRHLLPGRFPAAWNLASPKVFGDPSQPQSFPCPSTPVPTLVNDLFSLDFFPQLSPLFGALHLPDPPPINLTEALDHGYVVAKTLGASAIGANPFSLTSQCMDVSLVQISLLGGGFLGSTDMFVASMPTPGTKFVVNESRGYGGCPNKNACLPTNKLSLPIDRAYDALYYKARTQDRWGDFLFVQSAGNHRDEDVAAIYPGAGDSRFNSPRDLAQVPDPNFAIVGDDAQWTPSANDLARHFVSLKASAGELDVLKQDVAAVGLDGTDSIPDNIISVGSTIDPTAGSELTTHVTGAQMGESTFSERGPDVLTVGEKIPDLNGNLEEGTSFAAPQVAGLATYLWMLSPDLRSQPIAVTKRIIVANTYDNKFIDAYATALALDGTTLSPATAPMRLALLDANHDGVFDEQDIDLILSNLFVVDNSSGASIITHQAMPGTQADFSRFDLNGDGFTTAGARRERFDLDRTGSTQYGASQYSTVTQTIEGVEVSFDETALTDLQILCYYAYSPMFSPTGDRDARKTLLDGRCGLAIDPATVTVNTSAAQTFTASSPGGDPVTWTASCGAISPTDPHSAIYTAPATAETCRVTATSTLDNSLIATATVTVNSDGSIPAESALDLDMSGFDDTSGVPLFDQVTESLTTTGSSTLTAPLSHTFFSNNYDPDSSLPPANFKVTGVSDGPIVSKSDSQPTTGTYSESVSCSITGTAKHDENDNRIYPRPLSLRSSAQGNFEPLTKAGSYSVSFRMERREVVSGTALTADQSDLVGQVFVEYSLHGEQEQELEFNLNDGTQLTGATPAIVADTVGFTIEPGGFFQAGFSIGVRCASERDKDNLDVVASKRSGTLSLSYVVAPAP
jgi:hypothetical protein